MRFPIKFGSTPGRSKSKTDEEIRTRLASLPLSEEHTIPAPSPSPRRARTLPSRRVLSPHSIAIPPNTPQIIETKRYEDIVSASIQNTTQSFPRRTTSLLYKPQEDLTDSAHGCDTISGFLENIDQSHQTEPLTPSQTFLKTPKKSSPALSNGRSSLRDPFVFVKNTGRSIRRRTRVQSLFPVTPEKHDSLDDQVSQAAEMKIGDHQHKSLEKDYILQESPVQDPSGSNSSRYYTAKTRRSPYEQSKSRNTTDALFQHYYDAQEYLHSQNHQTVTIPSQTAISTSNDCPKSVTLAWPTRVSSQQYVKELLDITAPPNPIEVYASQPQSITFGNSIKTGVNSISEPKTDDAHNSVTAKEEDSEVTLGEIVKDLQGIPDRVRRVYIRPTIMRIKDVDFKNAHKNYFPVWSSEHKPDGRRYTQKEVIDIVSAGL